MNEIIYKIAAAVSTPLALAGITVAFFSSVSLALIKSNKLRPTSSEGTLILLRRLLTFFFVLSLVAAVLGFAGWIFRTHVDKVQRADAIASFSHLVTTMRIETDKLMLEYPDLYRQQLANGRSPNDAKEQIRGVFRQRIDAAVKGDQLGTKVRLAFPDFPWDHYFREGKMHYGQFFDSIHNAVVAGTYESNREKAREMRKDYLHHLEQRLDELRATVARA